MDELGFLVTPYREIKHGVPTDKVKWMRADEEAEAYPSAGRRPLGRPPKLWAARNVIARYQTDFHTVGTDQVQYMDISPKQMVGVSAGLIPFLEHDDANRALMGSNMQRQAVPLLVAEPPIVATGLERPVAMNSGMIVRAAHDGKVTYVDSTRIVLDDDPAIKLRKYVGLNERTCLNQKPVVALGQKVKKGDILADGAATYKGELALGRNVLVGFMAWDGYNLKTRSSSPGSRLVKRRTSTRRSTSRGVRDRDPRDEARPRGVHPRHPQRLREGPAEPSTRTGSSGSAPTASRATSWSARWRPRARAS